MSVSQEHVNAVLDVRNGLVQTFREALQTHGPAVTMSAVSEFAAVAVHEAEHLTSSPQARELMLGMFTGHFYIALAYLNSQCDGHGLQTAGEA